ncbi:MAG: acetyl-CoA carboxylase biotin carboxyl carrier protein [Acidobacteriota bacterium]|nr:acetyl-CoA carboxylase biotin carboxyl carrier protein [Acidobacteriota bacterium]
MTIDEIKKLIEVVRETGIAELEVQLGENRVRIRSTQAVNQEMTFPAVMPVTLPVASAPVIASAANVPTPDTSSSSIAPVTPKEEEQGQVVKSPIVGTYYDSPSPGAPPFVKVGDRVEPKQVLCIIESMKLMNEIEAEIAGVILAKHVENGRPVEYGESLFTVRPA